MTIRKLTGPTITAILAAAILILSLMPHPIELPDAMKDQDKIEHALAYFALAFSAFLTWEGKRARSRLLSRLLLTVLGCSLYGGIIEVLQSFVGRHMEFLDLVSDTAGAFLGSFAAMHVPRLWAKIASRARARTPVN